MAAEPKTIQINSVEYVRKDAVLPKTSGDIRIVILQRGWVFVGEYHQDGEKCWLENASCIRRWGTKQGLGELAVKGPLTNTTLEPTPRVEFHILTVIATINCVKDKWV